MTGIDRDAEATSDHAYFQALEEAFIRLRGAPLLLSPADWQLTREWHRRGIPLALIETVIGQVLAERRSRPGGDHIVSLRYFRRPVENAFAALGASGTRGEPESLDVSARLERLAASVPPEAAERIQGLEGDAERVEAQLAALQDELLDRFERSLSQQERAEIERTVDKSLAPLHGRVHEDEVAITRVGLRREEIRSRSGLPVLSLFVSPD